MTLAGDGDPCDNSVTFFSGARSFGCEPSRANTKMHRAPAARWLNRAFRIGDVVPASSIPLFLCPAARVTAAAANRQPVHRLESCKRFNHTETAPTTSTTTSEPATPNRSLPVTCSGCGAFSQTNDAHEQGYFDLKSKRVRNWIQPKVHELRQDEMSEDTLVGEALGSLDSQKLAELGLDPAAMISGDQDSEVPTQRTITSWPPCLSTMLTV